MKSKPKAIILENDQGVCSHAAALLEKDGWEVVCEGTSKKALELLASSKKVFYTLFISNFKLPKMEGDDILSKVNEISPLTQRMLMVPEDNPEILIKSINKAKINASIIAPFEDADLIRQSRICLAQFKQALKREQLKRVTRHQNHQMFAIAKKLKKKNARYLKHIDEKKSQKVRLKSKRRLARQQANLNADITLETLLNHLGTAPSEQNYNARFKDLANCITLIFKQITTQYKTSEIKLDLDQILNPEAGNEPAESEDQVTEENEKTSETGQAEKDEQTSQTEQTDETDSLPEASAEENGEKAPSHPPKILIENIVKSAYITMLKSGGNLLDAENAAVENAADETPHFLEELFEIRISDDKTQAFIKRPAPKSDADSPVQVADVLDMLLKKEISYGILEDDAIQIWLDKSNVDELMIAEGQKPVKGKDGVIQYHFQTDYTNPGKINEDGSIDFRDRGDVPFVSEGDLLARKSPPQEGKPGISISGIPIPIDDVNDPAFEAGNGVTLSEDKLTIHAQINGQPHLDKMGAVSVNPELVIPGDVDYETGNVDFKGNVVVKGRIKEGFSVKCANLTVKEIEGATVDITGDLNVSDGVTEAALHVQGNTYVRFINDSKLMGFGDLTVSKEIIDSEIILSGCCYNTSGHILSSRITTKLGIEAANIGTPSSDPVVLKIGVDEHLAILNKRIDDSLEVSVNKAAALKEEIKKLEAKDQDLYEQISEKAHVQDRSQIEIEQLKKKLPEIEKTNDLNLLSQSSQQLKALQQKAAAAEKELDDIFKTQDNIANEIERLKGQIEKFELENKKWVNQKKALKEFSDKDKARPQLTVSKTITQDTVIRGPSSSKILKDDQSRCKIMELAIDQDGIMVHEIQITDLN